MHFVRLKQRPSISSFQHGGLETRAQVMSPDASLQTWITAIHAGMTTSGFLTSVLKLIAVVLTAITHLSPAFAQNKITIGYAAVSPRTTPLYIAEEQGIFAKYG